MQYVNFFFAKLPRRSRSCGQKNAYSLTFSILISTVFLLKIYRYKRRVSIRRVSRLHLIYECGVFTKSLLKTYCNIFLILFGSCVRSASRTIGDGTRVIYMRPAGRRTPRTCTGCRFEESERTTFHKECSTRRVGRLRYAFRPDNNLWPAVRRNRQAVKRK